MNFISIEHLSLKIGSQILLDNISVNLEQNGVTMVMGQNGSGKSLFLRCLHGLIQPTKGKITVGNRPISETKSQQALVFQKPVMLRRNVADNLRFASPKPISLATLKTALGRVNLDGKLNQPARLLSGGEQQRLALVRALITNPKFLFLDEPTASLDPASALIIETIIRSISKEGVKVVCISHDIGQAKRIGTDILFLHNGRITEYSKARKFFKLPESREASAYLSGEIIF